MRAKKAASPDKNSGSEERTLPATATKAAEVIAQRIGKTIFHLHQNGQLNRTGGTLWLGAQVLACYVLNKYGQLESSKRLRAIDIGAGTGLLSVAMYAQGFDVVATDCQQIVDDVLTANVSSNLLAWDEMAISRSNTGTLHVKTLDWNETFEAWLHRSPSLCSNSTATPCTHELHTFDLIVTSDTIYKPELFQALLNTLKALSVPHKTTVLLALERRDSASIDAFLDLADSMKFKRKQIKAIQLSKALKAAGLSWEREDWSGIEVYEMTRTV